MSRPATAPRNQNNTPPPRPSSRPPPPKPPPPHLEENKGKEANEAETQVRSQFPGTVINKLSTLSICEKVECASVTYCDVYLIQPSSEQLENQFEQEADLLNLGGSNSQAPPAHDSTPKSQGVDLLNIAGIYPGLYGTYFSPFVSVALFKI